MMLDQCPNSITIEILARTEFGKPLVLIAFVINVARQYLQIQELERELIISITRVSTLEDNGCSDPAQLRPYDGLHFGIQSPVRKHS